MTLERYSHVMHMTSQVAGDLADGKGPIDVLRATFPAGTVSGAPKVRAMEIIDELEPTKRGPVRGRRRLRRLLGQSRHRDRDPHDVLARRPGHAAGGRRDRGRFGARADEDLECRNKARALLTAAAAARRLFGRS